MSIFYFLDFNVPQLVAEKISSEPQEILLKSCFLSQSQKKSRQSHRKYYSKAVSSVSLRKNLVRATGNTTQKLFPQYALFKTTMLEWFV